MEGNFSIKLDAVEIWEALITNELSNRSKIVGLVAVRPIGPMRKKKDMHSSKVEEDSGSAPPARENRRLNPVVWISI